MTFFKVKKKELNRVNLDGAPLSSSVLAAMVYLDRELGLMGETRLCVIRAINIALEEEAKKEE